MAKLTTVTPTIKGDVVVPVASTPAGDTVPFTGGDLLLMFDNGHSASITVEIAPTKTTGIIAGAGIADIPTRSLVLAAGAKGAILFRGGDASAYVNASRLIPITYTSGNALLTVLPIAL